MNVYDFDKTLYRRDSSVDFYKWCLRTYPRTILSLPRAGLAFALMALRVWDKTRCKQFFYRYLRHVPAGAPSLFWRTHLDGIVPWYAAQRRPDDVVISASPEFLLRPAAQALGFFLMASRVDQATGVYDGVNCSGAEKVRRFREVYPNARVDGFWSDSHSDDPMAKIADRAFLVRRGVPGPWR
jgi:phosphatidylglycerophosphatase C